MTTANIEPLTEKQAEAFKAIKDGSGPSDVAKAMGISPAGAHSHIKALQRKGYINSKLEILYAGPVSTDVLAAAKPAKSAAKAKPAKSAGKRAPKAKAKPKAKPKPAPTFDEMVPAVDISDDNGSSNGRHPSFEADEMIEGVLTEQRDLLVKSTENIAGAIAAHRGRIAAIDGEIQALQGERAEHEDAIATLEVRAASVNAALADLGAAAAA